MPDAPALPYEKLQQRRALCLRQGKEWNELAEINAINIDYQERNWAMEKDAANGIQRAPYRLLEIPANPELIPEDPRRARETRLADQRAVKEVQAAVQTAADAEKEHLKARLADQERELAEMKRQIAELTGRPAAPAPAAEPGPATNGNPAPLTGPLDASWSLQQLQQYAVQRGIVLPRKGVGMSKTALVDLILGEEQRLAAEARGAS